MCVHICVCICTYYTLPIIIHVYISALNVGKYIIIYNNMFLHLFLTVLCYHSPLPLPSSILPSFPLPYSNLFIFSLHITFTLLLRSLKPHPLPLFSFFFLLSAEFFTVFRRRWSWSRVKMSFCSMELVFRAQVYASVLFSGSDTVSDIQGFLSSSVNYRRMLQSCVSCPMYELLPFQGLQFHYWLQKVDELNSTCRLYPRTDEGPSQSLESCQC